MKVALLVDNWDRINELGGALNPLRDGLVAFLEALPPQYLVGLFTIGGQIRWTASRSKSRDRTSA